MPKRTLGKVFYGVAKDPWSIPGDCHIADSEQDAVDAAKFDLGIKDGETYYMAQITITPVLKMVNATTTTGTSLGRADMDEA